jgi:hypothetical protein
MPTRARRARPRCRATRRRPTLRSGTRAAGTVSSAACIRRAAASNRVSQTAPMPRTARQRRASGPQGGRSTSALQGDRPGIATWRESSSRGERVCHRLPGDRTPFKADRACRVPTSRAARSPVADRRAACRHSGVESAPQVRGEGRISGSALSPSRLALLGVAAFAHAQ